MITTNSELKEKYDSFYTDSEDEWRKTGAKRKSEHIIKMARRATSCEKLVEVGAGEGSILTFLDQAGIAKELYALEISTSGIDKIKEKNIGSLKEVRLFDGYQIPYPDKYFDIAACSHVIEHVEHPRLLLREIKRISRYQIFEVPIDFSYKAHRKADHFLSYGHINIFTPSLFKFLLLTEKFQILDEIASMYAFRSVYLSSRKNLLKFAVLITKWTIWNMIPFLRKRKPNTFTVLTE